MILLHLILSNTAFPLPPDITDATLITDVEKSLDIFRSMDNVLVARRCAEMIREVLDVAKAVVERRRKQRLRHGQSYPDVQMGSGSGNAVFSDYTTNHTESTLSQSGSAVFSPDFGSVEQEGLATGDFFSSLFVGLDSSDPDSGTGTSTGIGTSGGEFNDGARAGVLANLVDPSILGDFAFGGGYGSGGGNDFSIFGGS